MGVVVADQSVSLDAFSAGPNVRVGNPLGDNGDLLHAWYEEGGDQVRAELFGRGGAMLMGRTMFDVGVDPWGEDPDFRMPVFVLTHRARDPLKRKGGTTYFFVSGGIQAALEQARAAAGDKDVVVMGGAQVIRQFLNAGLVDELRIHLSHVLLGDGTRFFDPASASLVLLERTRLIETPGATHLTFRAKHRAAK